jgi:ATP-dependent DNA helicase HFM1/MER3
VRIVAVSATVPNAQEIAAWLDGRAMVFTHRPCPLQVHVVGYPRNKSEFLFERDLDRYVPDMLRRYAERRPTLVFVSSRKTCRELGERLAQGGFGEAQAGAPDVAAVSDAKLAAAMRRGVAWHSAELPQGDRQAVEGAFLQGKLGVVVCTSTLATGVDLPAYCVIVKSTRAYRGPIEGFQDLERATLVQMVGRAGRPGYDRQGVAVIMTERGCEASFHDLANGLVAVTSRLAASKDLAREFLNAEICRGTVTTERQLDQWWGRTWAHFLNPASSCREHLQALVELQCAEVSEGSVLRTATGIVASTHHLALSTVSQFARFVAGNDADSERAGGGGILAVLNTICQSGEFSALVPRRDQKRFLNSVAWTLGRFRAPKSTRVASAADKTLQLLQASLGHIAVVDAQLRQELGYCLERAPRLARAMLKMLVEAHSTRAVASALLLRSFELKAWELDEIGQLEGVGHKTRERLNELGAVALQDVLAKGCCDVVSSKVLAQAKALLESKSWPVCVVSGVRVCLSLLGARGRYANSRALRGRCRRPWWSSLNPRRMPCTGWGSGTKSVSWGGPRAPSWCCPCPRTRECWTCGPCIAGTTAWTRNWQ